MVNPEIPVHNHQMLEKGPINTHALWQEMKDTLGGMVVQSEPVIAIEKIRRLVRTPGGTELVLDGRALMLFQTDEMYAQEGDCVMVLLSKLQQRSHDRIIIHSDLDDLSFDSVMGRLKRKE